MPSSAAPAALYTLSLHDALPICPRPSAARAACRSPGPNRSRLTPPGTTTILRGLAAYASSMWLRSISVAATILSAVAIVRRSMSTDRKSTRLNSSHLVISYAVFCRARRALHSFPTRRSSDLPEAERRPGCLPIARPEQVEVDAAGHDDDLAGVGGIRLEHVAAVDLGRGHDPVGRRHRSALDVDRSEEHTSELQSPCNLVCRLLPRPPRSTLFPYTTLFRSARGRAPPGLPADRPARTGRG